MIVVDDDLPSAPLVTAGELDAIESYMGKDLDGLLEQDTESDPPPGTCPWPIARLP